MRSCRLKFSLYHAAGRCYAYDKDGVEPEFMTMFCTQSRGRKKATPVLSVPGPFLTHTPESSSATLEAVQATPRRSSRVAKPTAKMVAGAGAEFDEAGMKIVIA